MLNIKERDKWFILQIVNVDLIRETIFIMKILQTTITVL